MEREEFERILGGVELAPIEEYLHAVATQEELPGSAIGICAALIEEAAPALRAVLAKAADGGVLSQEDGLLAFRGLHILGAARDTGAWPILSRLLRRSPDEIDDLIGDTVTETLPRIATGMFNGDVDDLFALIADRAVDEYVRSSLFGTAAFLTWEGHIERQRMREFLERFYVDRLAGDEEFTWAGWQDAIALLGLRELAPLVDHAWEEGRIDTEFIDRENFESDLASAERAPDDIERFAASNLGYIEDVLDSLSWTSRPSDLDRELDAALSDEEWTLSEPYINPWRDVGRNDPCPCGSGKKAKKCCLA